MSGAGRWKQGKHPFVCPAREVNRSSGSRHPSGQCWAPEAANMQRVALFAGLVSPPICRMRYTQDSSGKG